jgi:hypothetical protein
MRHAVLVSFSCLLLFPSSLLALEPGVRAIFLDGEIGFGAAHAISADGNHVVFESDSDITGGNSDLNNELFLWDNETGFTQLTDTTDLVFYWNVDLDATGSTVVVVAEADITGSGAIETELYRWRGGVCGLG